MLLLQSRYKRLFLYKRHLHELELLRWINAMKNFDYLSKHSWLATCLGLLFGQRYISNLPRWLAVSSISTSISYKNIDSDNAFDRLNLINLTKNSKHRKREPYLTNCVMPNDSALCILATRFVWSRFFQVISIATNSALTFVLHPLHYNR